MSKSLGNYVSLSANAREMFAKLMSVPDELVSSYAELLTDIDLKEIKQMEQEMHPKEFKATVARNIAAFYHGPKQAEAAAEEFDRVFKEKATPQDVVELKINAKNLSALELLVQTNMVNSKSEARRVIEQGGFSINNEVVADIDQIIAVKSGDILKKGKRHFVKIS